MPHTDFCYESLPSPIFGARHGVTCYAICCALNLSFSRPIGRISVDHVDSCKTMRSENSSSRSFWSSEASCVSMQRSGILSPQQIRQDAFEIVQPLSCGRYLDDWASSFGKQLCSDPSSEVFSSLPPAGSSALDEKNSHVWQNLPREFPDGRSEV